MLLKKSLYIAQLCIFDVFWYKSDSRPTVWMCRKYQFTQVMPHVAVRFVEGRFFELLYHYFFLRIERFFAKSKVEHTVAF